MKDSFMYRGIEQSFTITLINRQHLVDNTVF